MQKIDNRFRIVTTIKVLYNYNYQKDSKYLKLTLSLVPISLRRSSSCSGVSVCSTTRTLYPFKSGTYKWRSQHTEKKNRNENSKESEAKSKHKITPSRPVFPNSLRSSFQETRNEVGPPKHNFRNKIWKVKRWVTSNYNRSSTYYMQQKLKFFKSTTPILLDNIAHIKFLVTICIPPKTTNKFE